MCMGCSLRDDVVLDIGAEQLFAITAAPHIQIHGDKGHLFDRNHFSTGVTR